MIELVKAIKTLNASISRQKTNSFDSQILAELRRLNEILAGGVKVTPDAWTPKTLAAHYKISVKAAERIIHTYGIPVDRERRLPEWKRRELEQTKPHFFAASVAPCSFRWSPAYLEAFPAVACC